MHSKVSHCFPFTDSKTGSFLQLVGNPTITTCINYSENTTVLEWAIENGCSTQFLKVRTPFSNRRMMHTCVEHPSCSSGAIVMYCYFPNKFHGFWPRFAEKLTWWFFSMHRRKNSVEN